MVRGRRELVERIALIAAVLLAIAALVARHQGSPGGRQFAGAIAAGAVAAGAGAGGGDGDLDEEGGAEDQNLSDEEALAGQLWARNHRGAGAATCPAYSPAFVRGCRGAMRP